MNCCDATQTTPIFSNIEVRYGQRRRFACGGDPSDTLDLSNDEQLIYKKQENVDQEVKYFRSESNEPCRLTGLEFKSRVVMGTSVGAEDKPGPRTMREFLEVELHGTRATRPWTHESPSAPPRTRSIQTIPRGASHSYGTRTGR
jgi:hypothetical protein